MDSWRVMTERLGFGSGRIIYEEGGNRAAFEWEPSGVQDSIMVVFGLPVQRWDAELSWTVGRRREVLERIAGEVIRLEAPGGVAEFTDGDTAIVIRRKPT